MEGWIKFTVKAGAQSGTYDISPVIQRTNDRELNDCLEGLLEASKYGLKNFSLDVKKPRLTLIKNDG